MSQDEKRINAFSPLTWELFSTSGNSVQSFPSRSASISSNKDSYSSDSHKNDQNNAELTPKKNSKEFSSVSVSTGSTKSTSNIDASSSNFQENAGQTPKKNSKEFSSISVATNSSNSSSRNTSSNSKYRKNAGLTPKSRMKSSLNIIKTKYDNQSQIEKNVLTLSKESINEDLIDTSKLDQKLQIEENDLNKSNGITGENANFLEKEKEYSTPIPLSQFPLMADRNTSSFLTVDEFYDSDVDMFEDPNFPEKTVSLMSEESDKFLNFADFSSEFEDKSKFPPPSVLVQTNYLQKELFDISYEEIKQKIDDIIFFFEEDSDE